MTTAEVLSAAYHESGHAVVSHKLGCIIQEIEVHFEKERNRWEGSYRHKLADQFDLFQEPFLRQKGAKVSIAGLLAQAKHDAIADIGEHFRFSEANDLSEWFSFFLDKTRTQDNPGSLKLIFDAPVSGQQVRREVDGHLFGGVDCVGFNQCFDHVRGVSSDDLILEVMALLDGAETWMMVERLASRLCECEADGEKGTRQLDRDAILDTLGRRN